MSTPLDRLLSAARSAVQHVRGRYQTEEPDYMDCLASALGQYEQAVRHPGYQVDIEPDTVVVEPCGQDGCACERRAEGATPSLQEQAIALRIQLEALTHHIRDRVFSTDDAVAGHMLTRAEVLASIAGETLWQAACALGPGNAMATLERMREARQ